MERSVMLTMVFVISAAALVFLFIAVVSWSQERRKERESLYRGETFKKIAEQQGGGTEGILQIMREEQIIAESKQREGLKIGGLVTMAAGVGISGFLVLLDPPEPIFGVGLIPLLIGAALLAYVYLMAPKPGPKA